MRHGCPCKRGFLYYCTLSYSGKIMRLFLWVVLAFSLSGCELIYKLPTRQGNVLEQKQLDQLQTGMTRDQVRFLLGTPLAASPYRPERWDYVGYYRSPRGKVTSRTVSLYFDGANKLSKMEGLQVANADESLESPDVDAMAREDKSAKHEAERDESVAPQPTDIDQPEAGQLPNP